MRHYSVARLRMLLFSVLVLAACDSPLTPSEAIVGKYTLESHTPSDATDCRFIWDEGTLAIGNTNRFTLRLYGVFECETGSRDMWAHKSGDWAASQTGDGYYYFYIDGVDSSIEATLSGPVLTLPNLGMTFRKN